MHDMMSCPVNLIVVWMLNGIAVIGILNLAWTWAKERAYPRPY